jgi:K+-sensing histidine kinase KdpD
MNSIVQYSEVTLESSEDYDLEDYKSFVTDINESTKSLYSLLENLLTWTRTNWGGVRIQEEATNLRRLIHNQIQVYAVQINSKAIKTDLPETEISVIVDQNMLKTVLRNVITNALTHMRNGGRLSFRWEANSNDRLTLRVVNEGHPIREDIAKALSEGDPFDAKVDIVSTGLGLRLCKATSDANEWSFKIEPLDDATQVTLSLKLDTNQAR